MYKPAIKSFFLLLTKNTWSQDNYDGQNITKFERYKQRIFFITRLHGKLQLLINDISLKHKYKSLVDGKLTHVFENLSNKQKVYNL